MKGPLLFGIILLLFSNIVIASSHYTYENAERLKPLINWYDYGPEAFITL